MLPDPKIKAELDVKKQKLEEIKTPVQQSPKIIKIDPAGDLLILFESRNVAYKVDSNALKRGSPKLYQQCLGVHPADSFAWTFTGVIDNFSKAIKLVLNLIHGNMTSSFSPGRRTRSRPRDRDRDRVRDRDRATFVVIRCPRRVIYDHEGLLRHPAQGPLHFFHC